MVFSLYDALVFVHHLTLFLVESVGFTLFWYSMLKTITSLLFTITIIVVLQYLYLNAVEHERGKKEIFQVVFVLVGIIFLVKLFVCSK